MPIGAKVHCGVETFRSGFERALIEEGLICPKIQWRLLVDIPFGWIISAHVTTEIKGAIVIAENPYPEYSLDVLEARPAAFLSRFSVPEVIRTLELLETGQEVALPKPLSPLTRAERLTLQLTARGYENKAIAKLRNTGEGTVKNSLQTIYQKLGLRSRVQLAHYYYGHWHVIEGWQPPRHALPK
jgi:DNA-binding CsgD family transcriptional regulator